MARSAILSHLRGCFSDTGPRIFFKTAQTTCSVSQHNVLQRQRQQLIRRLATTSDEPHIIRSPYENIDIPDCSFTEFMFSRFKQYGDLTAVQSLATGQTYTFRQLQDMAIRVASALTRLGIKKGDKILVFATNCPEYIILFLTCGATGIVMTTANPAYVTNEIKRQLEHSHASSVITLPEFTSTVDEAIGQSEILKRNIKHKIVIGESEGYIPFRKLSEDDGKAFPDNVDVNSHDMLVLPYSSGTTGLPKGVMLSHKNIIANVLQVNAGMPMDAGKDKLLGVLPFFHIYGMVVSQFSVTTQGASYVTMSRFVPKDFLEAIQKHRITYLHLVPPLLLFLAKDAMVENYDISSVRTIICGAAPLGADLTQQLAARVSATIQQAYGLTETSPVLNFDFPPVKMGTVGPLVPNTIAKVVDVATGDNLPPGDTGEVCARGPQVMLGYYENKAATDDIIKKGWLHTGDIGHFDEDGRLVITDRLKELIKYKGFQVPPAELESLLLSHPGIQDAGVVGIPDEDAGELPKAFVVLKPGHKLTPEEIANFVKENVTSYKQLRGGVEFIDQIPKSLSGKILRRKLKSV